MLGRVKTCLRYTDNPQRSLGILRGTFRDYPFGE
ncbi:hypothetical protein VPH5P1C_0060 [Vibrio phage 5P1c]